MPTFGNYLMAVHVLLSMSRVQPACYSSNSKYGHVLRNHVMASFYTGDSGECLRRCQEVEYCQSVNYFFHGLCELNCCIQETNPEEFEEQEQAMYINNIVGKLGSSSYKPASSCKEIKTKYNSSCSGSYWLLQDGKQTCHMTPNAGVSSCNTTMTVTGKCCVFPFTYLGVQYNSCTTVSNDNRKWCSLTSDYDKKWEHCVYCSTCTTKKGHCCTFPFRYKGKVYYSCITLDTSKPNGFWCAFTSDYDKDRKWDYCA